ncbi:MAG: hypothetical protein Q4G54_08875 [Pelistega sp.]|nr:hypothetical protein [Pelistega sp.]
MSLSLCLKLVIGLVGIASLCAPTTSHASIKAETGSSILSVQSDGEINNPFIAEASYLHLWRQGISIIQGLNLHAAEPSFVGKVFGLPMISWTYYKQERLETILHVLSQKKHPFRYIDVVNGLTLLQADLPKAKAIMHLQAEGQEAYSAYLSIITHAESPSGVRSNTLDSGTDEALLAWLGQEGQVLMDVETHMVESSRLQQQWIFMLPHEAQFLRVKMRELLHNFAWQEQSNLGLALNQWHKNGQVLHYYIDTIENNTTLYLNYSKNYKDDL